MNTRGNIALLLAVVLIPIFAGAISIIGLLSNSSANAGEIKKSVERKLEPKQYKYTKKVEKSSEVKKMDLNVLIDFQKHINPNSKFVKPLEELNIDKDNIIPRLDDKTIKKNKEEKRKAEKKEKDLKTAYITSNEKFIGYATRHTDLKNQTEVTAEDIDYIIDTVLNGRKSPLKGCGQALITASQKTELSPIFLLSLSAAEAGWVVSPGHARKNNPYSVNMTNTGGTATGYVFGNDYGAGLINGAIWINQKYYQQGQTSLHKFIYGKKSYCVPGEGWINTVASIMNRCYQILDSKNPKSA